MTDRQPLSSAGQLPDGTLRALLERHGVHVADDELAGLLEDLSRTLAASLVSLALPLDRAAPRGVLDALVRHTVDTPSELDELPAGSVVIDQRGDMCQRFRDDDTDTWEAAGHAGPALVELPALVVWVAPS